MLRHKINTFIEYNYWLKRLKTLLNEPTNQNSLIVNIFFQKSQPEAVGVSYNCACCSGHGGNGGGGSVTFNAAFNSRFCDMQYAGKNAEVFSNRTTVKNTAVDKGEGG